MAHTARITIPAVCRADWAKHREAMLIDLGTNVAAYTISAYFMAASVDAHNVVLREVVQADAAVVLALSSFEKCAPLRGELAIFEIKASLQLKRENEIGITVLGRESDTKISPLRG